MLRGCVWEFCVYKKYAVLWLHTNTHKNTDLSLVDSKIILTNMNFAKGAVDGQVNKVIDQAAGVAKEKIGEFIGGEQNKNKKQAGGIGNMVSGAIGKAAADHVAGDAAEQALSFKKKLLE
ncbi:hypothetical protein PDJAM_G00038990 [Pangasius djambal]|uniref:Uncharacterized protein n=1 Tax=Pangasius djambal TaxID=1691987 RepID=A0ACC5YSK3_9TELE|nr:hypothetical protein [Pangasius djambal]